MASKNNIIMFYVSVDQIAALATLRSLVQLPEMMAVLSQLKLFLLMCLSLGRNGWGPVGYFSLSTSQFMGYHVLPHSMVVLQY